jgi:hypothetical protein
MWLIGKISTCSITANVSAPSSVKREGKPLQITGLRESELRPDTPLDFKSFVFPVIIDMFFNLQINQITLHLTCIPLLSDSALAAGTKKFYLSPNPLWPP